MKQIREWDQWDKPGVADEIERIWTQDPSGYERDYRQVLAQLAQQYLASPTKKVLEVGCGSGQIYHVLVPNLLVNSSYVGVDTSTQMLKIARQHYPIGQFLYGDIYDLQFQPNSFDSVLCFEVLGHLPEIQKPISELVRVADRLVIFTAWVSPENQTVSTTEKILDGNFLHREYVPAEIIETIRQAVGNAPYRIEVRVLSDTTWAFVILKGGITDVQLTQGTERYLAFPFLTKRMIQRNIEAIVRLQERESELQMMRASLSNCQAALAARDAELEQTRATLATRASELAQVQADWAARTGELAQVKTALGIRDAELEHAYATLAARETEIAKVQVDLAARSSELANTRQLLTHRDEQLQQQRIAVFTRDTELHQARQTIQTRESELERVNIKGKAAARELDALRQRRLTRILEQLTHRSNAWDNVGAPFQQLKDDCLLFHVEQDLAGYLLQPSINLQHVPYVYYPLSVSCANLAGILLAPILDFPSTNGTLGIEIVSPENTIVAQTTIPLNQVSDVTPARLNFPTMRDSAQGQFWLRVFVRDADVPVRVFEWRKYTWFGLGAIKTQAFCGFDFQP